MGLTNESEIPFNIVGIIDKEIDIHRSFRYSNLYEKAIQLLVEEIVNVSRIVDFEAGIDDLDRVFQRP